MVHDEFFILNLRSHVRNLQALLNYLESCEVVDHDDYAYCREKLREVMKGLRELGDASSQRSAGRTLRAEWLNN